MHISATQTRRIFSKFIKYSKHKRALAKEKKLSRPLTLSKSNKIVKIAHLNSDTMADQTPSAKRPKSQEPEPGPSKKACDPRDEAAAPHARELPFGKRAAQKSTVPPLTEAQKEQMDAVKRAQEEHRAQAEYAARAKATKEATANAEAEPENDPFDFNGNAQADKPQHNNGPDTAYQKV